MAKWRCRACGKERTFVYDPEIWTCPSCDSIDVRFITSIDELPEDDPIVKKMSEGRMTCVFGSFRTSMSN